MAYKVLQKVGYELWCDLWYDAFSNYRLRGTFSVQGIPVASGPDRHKLVKFSDLLSKCMHSCKKVCPTINWLNPHTYQIRKGC